MEDLSECPGFSAGWPEHRTCPGRWPSRGGPEVRQAWIDGSLGVARTQDVSGSRSDRRGRRKRLDAASGRIRMASRVFGTRPPPASGPPGPGGGREAFGGGPDTGGVRVAPATRGSISWPVWGCRAVAGGCLLCLWHPDASCVRATPVGVLPGVDASVSGGDSIKLGASAPRRRRRGEPLSKKPRRGSSAVPGRKSRTDHSHRYRSSHSIPCRFRNSRNSSWNDRVRWCTC